MPIYRQQDLGFPLSGLSQITSDIPHASNQQFPRFPLQIPGTEQFASYYTLPVGSYTFYVTAVDNEGNESEPASVVVVSSISEDGESGGGEATQWKGGASQWRDGLPGVGR